MTARQWTYELRPCASLPKRMANSGLSGHLVVNRNLEPVSDLQEAPYPIRPIPSLHAYETTASTIAPICLVVFDQRKPTLGQFEVLGVLGERLYADDCAIDLRIEMHSILLARPKCAGKR